MTPLFSNEKISLAINSLLGPFQTVGKGTFLCSEIVVNGISSPDTDVKISETAVMLFHAFIQWWIRLAWNELA